MANEIIFNLDLNSNNSPSSFALSRQEDTIYFRPYKNDYLSTWSGINNVTLEFVSSLDSTKKIIIPLTHSDIVTINGESLLKCVFPSNMTGTADVFTGVVKINNSTNTMDMDIMFYAAVSYELTLMIHATLTYEEDLYLYLVSVKKDLLDKPNGVAILDANRKILTKYLPITYQQHIDSKIRVSEVHQTRLDSAGQMWYLDTDDNDTWKLVNGQPSPTPTHKPPIITVKDGVVTVKHDKSTVVLEQKWAYGDYQTDYFINSGTAFTGETFTVTKAGFVTYYYMIGDGSTYAMTIEIKETDIPFPRPTVTIKDGEITVTFQNPSKVVLTKWDAGVLDVGYFQTQGNVFTGSFIVTLAGAYSIYYKLDDGREYVMIYNVRDSDLPKEVPPTITIVNGTATVVYAPFMTIVESKWDVGQHDVPYFATDGKVIVNNTFEVTAIGIHTLYYKTARGNEYVVPFTVRSDQLKPAPPIDITVVNGVATVRYPTWLFVTLNKWDVGNKDIPYFRTNGNEFTGLTFIVTQTGIHTLYVVDQDGREYTKQFNVTINMLPPSIKPQYNKADSNVDIVVSNPALYVDSRYTSGQEILSFFQNGGGVAVNNWKIENLSKGWYTHYYKVSDGREEVQYFEMTDRDLAHVDPILTVNNGLFKAEHNQPAGVTVVLEKYADGTHDTGYFYNNGTVITNGKFYVLAAGTYTYYYKLSNGGEYVRVFVVHDSGLEKPVTPPTVTIDNKVVTVTFTPTTDVILKKWAYGVLDVPYFENNGTEFTGSTFTVTQIGDCTIYYKLRNEKEYVYHFVIKEEDLRQKFIPPTITIVDGIVTVKYSNLLNITMTKYTFGIQPVDYFELNGTIVYNNTFKVTQAGDYTLYSQMDGQFGFTTKFTVDKSQLELVDNPPVITVVDGIVTVTHDPATQVQYSKWDFGTHPMSYFATKGFFIQNNTFTVTRLGDHTYYYKNTRGQEYMYVFNVTSAMLPFSPPIIEVFDGLLTIEFTSPTPTVESKIAQGSQDKAYFQTDGDPIINNQYPITQDGVYTIWWKEADGRDFVTVISVTPDQVAMHISPTITITNRTQVNVTFDATTLPFINLKKYGEGVQTVKWFDTNGMVLNVDSFPLYVAGKYTYYYKYRTRGYVQQFEIEPLGAILADIPIGSEFIFGGEVYTRITNQGTASIVADETPYMLDVAFGSTNIISTTSGIGSSMNAVFYDYNNNLSQEEKDSILLNTWNNGTLAAPNSRTYDAHIGLPTAADITSRYNAMVSKGMLMVTNIATPWTSTVTSLTDTTKAQYMDSSGVIREDALANGHSLKVRMLLDNNTPVEKIPTITIVNGVVTLTETK